MDATVTSPRTATWAFVSQNCIALSSLIRDLAAKLSCKTTRLRWPDALSESPDCMLYITASHIQNSYWFKPGAPPAVKTALFSFAPQ
jgi:hypothetical protein